MTETEKWSAEWMPASRTDNYWSAICGVYRIPVFTLESCLTMIAEKMREDAEFGGSCLYRVRELYSGRTFIIN